MLIRIRPKSDIASSEITHEALYLRRREFLREAALGTGAVLATAALPRQVAAVTEPEDLAALGPLEPSPFSTDEIQTPFDAAVSYNNFYEFGTDKEDPARYAHSLETEPWPVSIEGEVAKPGERAFEDLVKPHALQERIYRLRCVEAWSMVIPWIGIPLGDVLRRLEPSSRAEFVEFRTLHDRAQMRGQRRRVLDWPYREGLRMDEAMHPLTILAVGLYGRVLPNQNGAPLRLVVPWKYGFKSIKSIVSIRLTRKRPKTSWNMSAAREYGFYANVNPDVDHPRWSQKRERRIGNFFKRPTLPFNGYAEDVASLYAGMNLAKNY